MSQANDGQAPKYRVKRLEQNRRGNQKASDTDPQIQGQSAWSSNKNSQNNDVPKRRNNNRASNLIRKQHHQLSQRNRRNSSKDKPGSIKTMRNRRKHKKPNSDLLAEVKIIGSSKVKKADGISLIKFYIPLLGIVPIILLLACIKSLIVLTLI